MARAKGLNAYIVETPEQALAMATASDAKLAAGDAGPLEGLPIGVKDLYATEGRPHPGVQPHPRRLQADL